MLSYEPFYQTMKRKGITSYHLIEKLGLSRRTYYRIKAGNHVSTATIIQLCDLLDCEIYDIIRVEKPGILFLEDVNTKTT